MCLRKEKETLCFIIKSISKNHIRNGLVLLGGAIIAGIVILSSNVINLPTFRYLNAANPFLLTTDMLTDSVSEHATTTTETLDHPKKDLEKTSVYAEVPVNPHALERKNK